MFDKNFKIKHWHYETDSTGTRKRKVETTRRKGGQKKLRRPCVVCGKPTLNILCSTKCVNSATPEQWRKADEIGLTLIPKKIRRSH